MHHHHRHNHCQHHLYSHPGITASRGLLNFKRSVQVRLHHHHHHQQHYHHYYHHQHQHQYQHHHLMVSIIIKRGLIILLIAKTNIIIIRHSMPSLPSLFADHSLTYVNGRLLLCGGSHAAR